MIRTSDDAGDGQGPADRRLRPVRAAGDLHPRPAAAPPDQVLADRARDRAGRAASARSRSSRRSSATRSCCSGPSRPSSPTSPRRTARRGAPCCWSRPARPAIGRHAARGRRRPVLGAAVARPGCSPAPTTADPLAARGRPRTSTTSSSAPCARPPAASSAWSPRAGRMVRLSALELPTLPADRTARPACPAARRWRPTSTCPPGEEPLTIVLARRRRPRPRPRHRARASSSGSRPTTRDGRDLEVIALRDGDSVVGAAELRDRRGGPRLRHQRRPAAALLRARRCARRAARPAAWPASSSPPVPAVVFFGAVDPAADERRGHLQRLLGRAARHRARLAQGDAVCRVPAQGPRHRRACAATASSRARTPSCSPGPAATPARAAGANGVAARAARRPTGDATARAPPPPRPSPGSPARWRQAGDERADRPRLRRPRRERP